MSNESLTANQSLTMNDNALQQSTVTLAKRLGYSGALPFYLCLLAIWLSPWRTIAAEVMVTYGAVILTFVGALHWGRMVTGGEQMPNVRLTLTISVLPALLAWVTLLLPITSALPLLVSGFMLVCWFEGRFQLTAMQPWMRQMRRNLTWIVSTALVVAWLGLLLA